VLVVAGSLLMWGYSFANSNVHDQLAQQQAFFPTQAQLAKAAPGTEITPGMVPYIAPHAGQQVLTGSQAEVYANHFIAVHLSQMPYHGVYASLSQASRADPGNAKLAGVVQASFQGTTLRGLLLQAYAFWMFGQIALWAGVTTYVLAAAMAVLVAFGFWHAARTPPNVQLVPSDRRREERDAA
jgi:hypothetical protein